MLRRRLRRRRQAPARRKRVRLRRQERRRDGPVRPDVDHRDWPAAGSAAGFGGVARRRGHLGWRGCGRADAAGAIALPGPAAAVVGRRRRGTRAAAPARRRRGGGLAGVHGAERQADGDDGRDPRGVEERRGGGGHDDDRPMLGRGGGRVRSCHWIWNVEMVGCWELDRSGFWK